MTLKEAPLKVSGQVPFDFRLQHEFVFENFICATGNEALLKVLQEQPGSLPLIYLWGNEGSGRSHLLQAASRIHASAAYLPLRLYRDQGPALLANLHELDMLCIDDIDCVLGNRDWEEALFSLFNRMRETGRCLIVSAAAAPLQLDCLLPDLRSRLQWGAVYALQMLDDEQKTLALRMRAEQLGIPLNDEVLNFIMLRSSRNMHDLFAVLGRLDRLSLSQKRKITIPFIKQIMAW